MTYTSVVRSPAAKLLLFPILSGLQADVGVNIPHRDCEDLRCGCAGMLFWAATDMRHMVGCQSYGPFLGTLNTRCRIVIGTQKRTIIFTTTHILDFGLEGAGMRREVS